jgi:hypothetical protein
LETVPAFRKLRVYNDTVPMFPSVSGGVASGHGEDGQGRGICDGAEVRG